MSSDKKEVVGWSVLCDFHLFATEPSKLITDEVSKTVSPVVLAKVLNENLHNIQQRAGETISDKKKVVESSSAPASVKQSSIPKQASNEANLHSGFGSGSGSEKQGEKALEKKHF